MFKSQLVQTVLKFDEDEIIDLGLFLRSPYYSRTSSAKDYVNLFGFITNGLITADPATALGKDNAYKALFPDKEIVKGKIDKLMSGLLKLVQEFVTISYNDVAKNYTNRQLALAQFYRKHQMESRFESVIAELHEEQKKRQYKNADFFYSEYLISNEAFQYEDARYVKKGELSLPEVAKHLDLFYLTRKLELVLAWGYAKKFVNAAEYDSISIVQDTIPAFLKRETYNLPIISIFTLAIEVANDATANDDNYQRFVEILEQHHDELPTRLMKDFQAYLRSYCVSQYNKGRETYLLIGFELFKKHLERGYYFLNDDDKLSISQFQSLVAAGVKTSNFEWTKWFLATYKTSIEGFGDEEIYYNYNLANYHFYKNEFDTALGLLAVNYPDMYYTLAARRMEIKIFYETDSEVLEAKIEAFKVYIFRLSQKTISYLASEMNNAFIDILRQIVHPSTLENTNRIEKIITRLNDKKIISERDWLREKLAKMQSKLPTLER